MADSRFPRFFNLPANDKLQKLLFCTGKGQSRDGNHEKHKYFLGLCRYTCTLPSWDQSGRLFCKQYKQSLLDMAMIEAIGKGDFLKWSQLISPVYPVAVPDDDQSVFHAVSTAMWGLLDKHNTLKQLMETALPDMTDNLKARWQLYASDVKDEDRQTAWSNIITRLLRRPSVHKSFRSDEEIDSLAVYILANVIHRPIIVIEIPSQASPHPTEGIFLPLERPPLDCSKSPIILCHRDHRFCPLMFISSANCKTVFPLHKGDLSILPVRYAFDDGNTLALLSQYLNIIQDKDVISGTGSTMTLFFSSVAITPLPEHFNSINSHLKICREIFQDCVASQMTNDSVKQKASLLPVGQHNDSHPFQYIDESNQTYVVPLTGSTGEKEGNILSPPPLPVTSPHSQPSSPYNCKTSVSHKSHQGIPKNIKKSSEQLIVTESNPERENRDKGKTNKCLTPGCVSDRDPGIGELCYSCFTRSTVDESGLELLSVYEDGKRRYILCEAQLPGADIDQQQHSILSARYKIPLRENISEVHTKMLSAPFLSVVNESCKGCCNYYCSQKTYPYCHECSKKASETSGEQTLNQTLAPNVERNNATILQSFPDAVLLPPTNLKHPGKSLSKEMDINRKQDEIVFKQIAQNFCQSKSCHNLRQENSNFCFQCTNEGKSNGKPSLDLQVAPPHHQISSSERKETLELGQAECLSHNSNNEDVIEISEAPSVDAHKCASPVCYTIISSSEMLCEKCQSILISHSKHHNKNEHLRGAKNDWENQQILSTHRTGTFSSVIANSPSLVKQPQKILSEKIYASGSKIGLKPKEIPGSEREMRMKSKEDKVKRTSDPCSHSCSSTSINSYVSPQASQPNSFSRAVDNNFQKMYMQFTNDQVKDMTKCRSSQCQNYGNKLKQGYCNACFSILSEDEAYHADFRVPQSDSC